MVAGHVVRWMEVHVGSESGEVGCVAVGRVEKLGAGAWKVRRSLSRHVIGSLS
jgi:hypothetical protein